MSRRSFSVGGFTLIELLVATAVAVLMAGIVLVVVRGVSHLWARAFGRLSAEAQARYVLDQLALDLQGALYRDDGRTWLAATVPGNVGNSGLWLAAQGVARAKPANGNGSLNLGPASIADARYGIAGAWLRFFTTSRGANDATSVSTAANTASAPVAVGWQIIRRALSSNPLSSDVRYLLHRAQVRPAQDGPRPGVLESGYDITAGGYTGASTSANGATLGDPRSIQRPQDLNTVMAENVIDFGVRFYVRVPDPATGAPVLRQIFPAGASDLTHTASLPPSSGILDNSKLGNCFPEVADVMVRVLTDEGAGLIAALESNPNKLGATRPQKYPTDAAWWWGLAGEHSRVFTRRIVLPAQSP